MKAPAYQIPSSNSAGRTGWLPGTTLIFLFWFVLFLLGHPLSFVDDLFFVGPAINAVVGDGFYNPYCPTITIMDPQKEFFVYMPLQGHVLAAWVYFFGYGRLSFATFQCLFTALATLALWRVAFRQATSLLYPLALSLCVAVFTSTVGLRPEPLGLALFCWGLFVLRVDAPFAWFLACLSLFATGITSPNIGVMVPLVLLGVAYRTFALEADWKRKLRLRFILATASFALVFLLLLVLVHFDLGHFLSVMNRAKGIASQFALTEYIHWTGSARNTFRAFVHILEPMIALCAGVAAALTWRRHFTITPPGVILLWLVGIVLLVPGFSSATGFSFQAFYCVVALLFLASRAPAFELRLALPIWFAVCLVYLFANGHRFFQLASASVIHPMIEPSELRSEVQRLSGPRIYVDQFALNSVYNYHLPPGALDFRFGLTDRFLFADLSDFPPGSIFVISKETLILKGYRFDKSAQPPHMPLIGALFPFDLANPYDCVVVQTPVTQPLRFPGQTSTH